MKTQIKKNPSKTAGATRTPAYNFPLETVRVQRLARNVAAFLQEMNQLIEGFLARTKRDQSKILAEIKYLSALVPPKQREAAVANFFSHVQQALEASTTRPAKGRRSSRVAAPLIKVDGQGDCLGTPGRGITVKIDDDTTIGVCVTGDITSPTGGGISYRHSC